jgi:hypothetical protein
MSDKRSDQTSFTLIGRYYYNNNMYPIKYDILKSY